MIDFLDLIDPNAAAAIIGAALAALIGMFSSYQEIRRARERLAAAEKKSEEAPDKGRYAWDLARIPLESYFNRNLSQVTAIFWLSVGVMIAGFVIIGWGVVQAVQDPSGDLPAIIAGLAGVITELIGATFLLIYRSTIQQAAEHMKTLERINSVGMAMQILDTMPNVKTPGIKDTTKAAVVTMLMQHSCSIGGAEISGFSAAQPDSSPAREENTE